MVVDAGSDTEVSNVISIERDLRFCFDRGSTVDLTRESS